MTVMNAKQRGSEVDPHLTHKCRSSPKSAIPVFDIVPRDDTSVLYQPFFFFLFSFFFLPHAWHGSWWASQYTRDLDKLDAIGTEDAKDHRHRVFFFSFSCAHVPAGNARLRMRRTTQQLEQPCNAHTAGRHVRRGIRVDSQIAPKPPDRGHVMSALSPVNPPSSSPPARPSSLTSLTLVVV